MPPGMLQKMRQGAGGGGMQDMMKAMMGGNVSDEDMAEMQSQFLPHISLLPKASADLCSFTATEMASSMMGGGMGGMPDFSSMMKNMGGMFGGGGGAGR